MPVLYPIFSTLALLLASFAPSSALDAVAPPIAEDWLTPRELTSDRSLFEQARAIGRLERVADGEIVAERRSDGERVSFPLASTSFILFAPHDESEADAFGDEPSYWVACARSRIWLRNGDAFDGDLIRMDRRRVYFSAFGRELTIPRGRVVAIRLPKDDALEIVNEVEEYSIESEEIDQ